MARSRPRGRFLLGFALGALLATATTAIAQHGWRTMNASAPWGIRASDTGRFFCIDEGGLPRPGAAPVAWSQAVSSGPPWGIGYMMLVVNCPR